MVVRSLWINCKLESFQYLLRLIHPFDFKKRISLVLPDDGLGSKAVAKIQNRPR